MMLEHAPDTCEVDPTRSTAPDRNRYPAGTVDGVGQLDLLLRRLDDHRHVPLSVDIDCLGLAQAVVDLGRSSGRAGELAGNGQPMTALSACRGALRATLADTADGEHCETSDVDASRTGAAITSRASADEPGDAPTGERVELASWIDRLFKALRAIDPEAARIVRLRAAGCTNREIADELNLGARLIARIVADARRACGQDDIA